ncbi:thyroid receptor-interacting protein 11-like isoform X2 [Corticium candelabrum]|uniref:thyroid receptor-interacting protein 11-like isoform X2 n=1 Tax=Corticium candelabrum TaxID=121492 RepID=UPI002E267FAA|nr:thyroid receptor-interacting protein 11-like isoform X2 [Corticium candelabrum]
MLKHQLDELEEHHNQLLQHSPTKVDLSLPPSHISVREHHEESSVTDLITAQMEINQLSSKNERLQAQVKHWKSISQNKQGNEASSNEDRLLELQVQLEAVRHQLSEEVDLHQSQVAALQNEHLKKLTLMRNKHELEVGEKDERINDLNRQLYAAGRQSSVLEPEGNADKNTSKLQEELDELHMKYAVGEDTRRQLSEQTEKEQCESEYRQLADKLAEMAHDDHKPSVNRKDDSDGLDSDRLELLSRLDESMSDLQAQSEENEILQQKTIQLKTTVKDLQQQLNEEQERSLEHLSDLRKENVHLRDANVELQLQVKQRKDQSDHELKKWKQQTQQLDEALSRVNEEQNANRELKSKLEKVQHKFDVVCIEKEERKSEHTAQISSLKDSKDSLQIECLEVRKQTEELVKDKMELEGTKQRLETQLDAQLLKLEDKTQECVAMHQQLLQLTSDLETVLQEKSDLEKDVLRDSEQHKFKEHAFAALREERDSLAEELAAVKEELQQLNEGVENQEINSDSGVIQIDGRNTGAIAQQSDEAGDTADSKNETHAQLYAALQQYQQIHATYTQNLLAFQAETERLKSLVNERDNQLAQLQQMYSSLVKQIEEKDRNFGFEAGRLNELVESTRRDLHQMKEEHQTLVRCVANVKVEGGGDSLSQKVEQLIITNKRERDVAHSLRDHNGQLLETIAENKGRQAQLERELEQLSVKLQGREKEIGILKSELIVGSKTSQATVERSGRELDRLRAHLIEVEETYTKEAVRARERESDLVRSLQSVEDKLRVAQQEADSRNNFTQSQLQSLQDQLNSVCSQRDSAMEQLITCQADLDQKIVQLTNLQMVLEQFSADKDQQIGLVQQTMQQQFHLQQKAMEELRHRLTACQVKLAEAQEAAADCNRLRGELDRSHDTEQSLRLDVAKLEAGLQATIKRLHAAKLAEDEFVEKKLVKNWLLGYMSSTEDKKQGIENVLANIVGVTEEDLAKVRQHRSGWLSRWLPGRAGHDQSIGNNSFSEQFVRFLQEESTSSSLVTVALPKTPTSVGQAGGNSFVSTAVDTSGQLAATPDSPKPWKYSPQAVTLTGSSFHLVPTVSTPKAHTGGRDTETELLRTAAVASSQEPNSPSFQTQTLLEVLDSSQSGSK